MPYLPLHHQYDLYFFKVLFFFNFFIRIISYFIVFCTFGSFIMASRSDPGKITKDNVHKYIENYEYDGVLYTNKTCPTCDIPRLVINNKNEINQKFDNFYLFF